MRMKMFSRFLLLTALICCVCGLEVNVSQNFFQAEEKQSVTLDWTFTPKPDPSLDSLYIFCSLDGEESTPVFHFQSGFQVPLEEDEFAGRVRVDKDKLREGKIQLHVFSLRTEDSGLYKCEVHSETGTDVNEFYLDVKAATGDPTSEENDVDTWTVIILVVLVLVACGIVYAVKNFCIRF